MAKTHSNFIRSQAAKAKALGVKSGIGGGSMKAPQPMAAPMGGNSMMNGGGMASGQNVGLMPMPPKGGRFGG